MEERYLTPIEQVTQALPSTHHVITRAYDVVVLNSSIVGVREVNGTSTALLHHRVRDRTSNKRWSVIATYPLNGEQPEILRIAMSTLGDHDTGYTAVAYDPRTDQLWLAKDTQLQVMRLEGTISMDYHLVANDTVFRSLHYDWKHGILLAQYKNTSCDVDCAKPYVLAQLDKNKFKSVVTSARPFDGITLHINAQQACWIADERGSVHCVSYDKGTQGEIKSLAVDVVNARAMSFDNDNLLWYDPNYQGGTISETKVGTGDKHGNVVRMRRHQLGNDTVVDMFAYDVKTIESSPCAHKCGQLCLSKDGAQHECVCAHGIAKDSTSAECIVERLLVYNGADGNMHVVDVKSMQSLSTITSDNNVTAVYGLDQRLFSAVQHLNGSTSIYEYDFDNVKHGHQHTFLATVNTELTTFAYDTTHNDLYYASLPSNNFIRAHIDNGTNRRGGVPLRFTSLHGKLLPHLRIHPCTWRLFAVLRDDLYFSDSFSIVSMHMSGYNMHKLYQLKKNGCVE